MATGFQPYEEAAARAKGRMSLLQRLGQAFAGAGQGIAAARGADNPLEALGLGFSGAYGARSAAQQAAEQYAQKKIEAERAQEERQARLGLIEAQTERAKKPEKPAPPPKSEFGPRPWYLAPEWIDTPQGKAARVKAEHIPVKADAGPKATKAPKALTIPRRIPPKITEQAIIDSINQESDPAALMPYYTGRGGADSEAIRRAAQLRANDLQRQRH